MTESMEQLQKIAATIRGIVVEISHKNRIAHLASCLSCIDILVASYWTALNITPENVQDDNRDRFLLSKGHAASALYAVLAEKGFIEPALLETQGEQDSPIEEHPGPGCIPGVEIAAGSLGHGLPMAIGMALAARIQNRKHKIIVLQSDGECNEGSVWEAAMFAAGQKLSDIKVFIDFNKWQATGRSCEIMALEPLRQKWQSFGWNAREIDGHDMKAVVDALAEPPDKEGRPSVIVAHTVKGKGISFMEDDNNWHYRIPTAEEVVKAKQELGLL